MTVDELIAELKKLPPMLPVVIWDEEEDDWAEIVQSLWEDATTYVALLTEPVNVIVVTDPSELDEVDPT